MRAVMWLWFGQLISLVGTGMTRFAGTVWIWQQTESATAVAFFWFFVFGPGIVLSPIAGALVDRWNRKRVLIGADLGAGLATIGLLVLYLLGVLEIWHFFVAGFIASAFEAFQNPAQAASITTMVPREQFGRANGIMSMVQFGATVVSPALAGILLAPIGLQGIFGIDVVTFLFAVAVLFLLRIPQPPRSAEGAQGAGSLRKEIVYGFRYLTGRTALLSLLGLFGMVTFLVAFFVGVINPMILARTANDETVLGLVLSLNGVGGVLGGLLLSTWGGPKTRIFGVLGGVIAMNFGIALTGLGQSLWLWGIGAFLAAFFIPIINGCNRAIFQSKIAPDVQGRVFGVMRVVGQAAFPLAMLIVGPLADYVFEPAMMSGGALAPLFGAVVGIGEGAGMSLMMLLAGLAGILVGLLGFVVRNVRDVETLLPDQVPGNAAAAE
jgi:predicted MFS family arabinose efflux permease